MIDRVLRRLAAVVLLSGLAGACTRIPPEPLSLDAGLLIVNNGTSQDWRGVEIWINRYFRAMAPEIAHGTRFQVPLDVFVDGYGRRFDRQRLMITDVRLTAKNPDGTPVAETLAFKKGGLADLQRKP
jgi:hypothetical protein